MVLIDERLFHRHINMLHEVQMGDEYAAHRRAAHIKIIAEC